MIGVMKGPCSCACRLALGHCIATLAGQLRHHIPAPMAAAFQNPTGGVATTSGHILGIWAGPQSPLLGAALNSAAYSSVRHTSSMVMGVPVGQQEESRMSAAHVAVSDEALPVLEAAYGLYVEHFVLGGPEHSAKHWAAALEAAQPVTSSRAISGLQNVLDKPQSFLELAACKRIGCDREGGRAGMCQSSKLQDKFIFLSSAIMSYGVTFAAPLQMATLCSTSSKGHFVYLCTS